MRCFLSVEVPEEIKSEIIKVGKEFNFIGKHVERENLHLTLKFFGDIKEKNLGELREKLRKIKFNGFLARMEGIGIFPSEMMMRVLWAGVEPRDKMKELYEVIERSLGNKPERFESHITIARIKSIKDKKKFLEKMKSINFCSSEFEVKGFVLKKSTLTPIGPIYEDIERFGLN